MLSRTLNPTVSCASLRYKSLSYVIAKFVTTKLCALHRKYVHNFIIIIIVITQLAWAVASHQFHSHIKHHSSTDHLLVFHRHLGLGLVVCYGSTRLASPCQCLSNVLSLPHFEIFLLYESIACKHGICCSHAICLSVRLSVCLSQNSWAYRQTLPNYDMKFWEGQHRVVRMWKIVILWLASGYISEVIVIQDVKVKGKGKCIYIARFL